MLAKFDENSYIDVDLISYIDGSYGTDDETRWHTTIIVDGVKLSVYGRAGKNVMDSYLWKHKHVIYDMIHGSESYRKLLK